MYGTTAPNISAGLVAPDDSLVFKDDKVYLPDRRQQIDAIWQTFV